MHYLSKMCIRDRPYLNYHQSLSKEDEQIIDWAIEVTNIKENQHKKAFQHLYNSSQKDEFITYMNHVALHIVKMRCV